MLTLYEKNWEEQISKLNPEDKDYQKNIDALQKIKEEQKKIVDWVAFIYKEKIIAINKMLVLTERILMELRDVVSVDE